MAVALFMIEEDENRRALRRDRVFRDRLNPLDVYDDVDILRRYRFTRPVLLEVIDLLEDDISPFTRRSHAVPATLQVCCALRYFATGTFQLGAGDMVGLSQPTVSRIITRVANGECVRARQSGAALNNFALRNTVSVKNAPDH